MCGFLVSHEKVESNKFAKALKTIHHRGPDDTEIEAFADGSLMGFHRLAIMDLRSNGNQPFCSPEKKTHLVCNGEIYNHKEIRTDYVSHYPFQSQSDCEVLLPLYEMYGLKFLCENVDAEFAVVLYDHKAKDWRAARDPIGIRPLFYGYGRKEGKILFASEAKALLELCEKVEAFPPGHYYQNGEFHQYASYEGLSSRQDLSLKEIEKGIAERLAQAVEKRLCADAPVGFLLSGGLDSSLVCAIAAKKLDRPIKTFAIGFEEQPIDLKYAREVANHIGSDHHEVIFTRKDVERALKPLIYQLETYDITTIRAAMGMYLLCEYIQQKTDVKVLLTGEVSDEIFGYKYTDYAPSPEEFQKEAEKRVRELYMYDVLRADRCISAHSIEARVPFADHEFVRFVMEVAPRYKMNSTGVGKHLLRRAFSGSGLLPKSILYREKAAFSDAVGHGMVDYLKARAEKLYGDEWRQTTFKYQVGRPISKEALMYRQIFDQWYGQQSHLITDFWMPNREWEHCDVADPSARALPNYGQSGS